MTQLVDKILKNMDDDEREKLTCHQINTLRKFDKHNRRAHLTELTRGCQLRIISAMVRIIGKNFREITKRDMEAYFDGLKVNPYTIEHRRLVVVKFFKWLYGKEKHEKPPIVVSGLKPDKNAYNKDIPPSMLWNDEEIKQLIMAFTHPRDKALVATLYDSEARIGELLSMDIKDCQIEGDTVSIFLPLSKTQKRRVGLIFSVPYLLDWINHHPRKNIPDAPLWISLSNRAHGKRLSDSGAYDLLKNGQKRCDINKHINPHLLRHSMASKLRKAGLPDALHRRRMGLSPGSRVIERYTHIDDEEVHNGYLRALGYKPKEKVEEDMDVLKPRVCFRCGTENTATAKYCSKCFTSLDYESVDRDLGILELFKSSFAKFEGVDVDNMLCEYKRFKAETQDMEKVLDCFNGGNVVTNAVVKNALKLSDDDCINLLEYLCTAELIEMDGDKVVLLDRRKYQNFLTIQKRYLEVNAK